MGHPLFEKEDVSDPLKTSGKYSVKSNELRDLRKVT